MDDIDIDHYVELIHAKDNQIESLRAALAEAEKDTKMIDWLEEQAKKSQTGISFDYGNHVEDGQVLEKGYRFMRRHFLGDRCDTLRKAIDAARANESKTRSE